MFCSKFGQQLATRKARSVLSLAVVMMLAATILVGCSSSNDIDYIETVRTLTPFDWDGEMATIEDVANRFFNAPTWRERTGSRNLTYVDLRGIVQDVDGRRLNIVLTYSVTPSTDGDDYSYINPVALEINNTLFGADAAESFEIDLFDAYTYGYESLAAFFLSMGYSQGIAHTFAYYFDVGNVGGGTGGNQGNNEVHATFGSTFEHQGVEYVIGDSWHIETWDGAMPADIIVPVRITNISNIDAGHLFGLQTWSPEGVTIPGMMLSDLQGGLMRPGVSLDGEIRIGYRGYGEYVLEVMENIQGTLDMHAVIVITLPIFGSDTPQETVQVDGDWVNLGVISIPDTWFYAESHFEEIVFQISNDIDDTIAMAVWIPAVEAFHMITESNIGISDFQFNDGYTGLMIEFYGQIIWAREDMWMGVGLLHLGDRSVFTDNEDVILAIVRSLTPQN